MSGIKFQHDSTWMYNGDIPDYVGHVDHRVSKQGLGGYAFPILDTPGGRYCVTIYHTPQNAVEFGELRERIYADDVCFAYVDDDKVVVITAEFKLSDLGLTVLTRDHVAKTIKRGKTIARPFRIHTTRERLNVQVVEGGKELDGAGIVSVDLYMEAVFGIQLGYWHPAQRATLLRWFEKQRIHNARFIGYLEDALTGEPLNAFGKGNFIVAKTPPGIDVITTWDNLKHEVTGDKYAWACFEPQGSKEAWEDQQTTVNQRFVMSIPEARERMADDAAKNLAEITEGRAMSSVTDLAKSEFYKDFAWDNSRFFRELCWNVNAWALYGLSYTLSPWLTERLGLSWVNSLGVKNPRKLRIKIPCGIRAQVVSEALVALAGIYIDVEPGQLRWCEELNVLVANDDDWMDIIIPSHGGCDLDDFFVARYRRVEGEYKIIITRSPNTRGEYTCWNYVPGDWYPTSTTADGEEFSFPNIGHKPKAWPKQILTALEDGSITYIDLPSASSEPDTSEYRRYARSDAINALRQVMSINGGYGQYELAVRALNSMSTQKMDSLQIRSEDAVDAFTQGGTPEDRAFILEDRQRIITNILATKKPVDAIIGSRLGVKEIPLTVDGPVTKIKKIIAAEVDKYKLNLGRFCASIEVPWWLEHLGRNAMFPYAAQVLRECRRQMYFANQATIGMETEDRMVVVQEAQSAVLQNIFDSHPDPAVRAQFCIAFWLACRTIPTSNGKLTDQAVFGTVVFGHLLDAMVYYGLAARPYVTERGHIAREVRVIFTENKDWEIACISCGKIANVGFKGVVWYWKNKSLCKNCIPTKEESNAGNTDGNASAAVTPEDGLAELMRSTEGAPGLVREGHSAEAHQTAR